MVKRNNKLVSLIFLIGLIFGIILVINQIYFYYKLSNAYYNITRADGEDEMEIYKFYRTHLSRVEYIEVLKKAIEFNDLENLSDVAGEANSEKYCELLPILQKKYNELINYPKDTIWNTELEPNYYHINRLSNPENNDFYRKVNELMKKCKKSAPLPHLPPAY